MRDSVRRAFHVYELLVIVGCVGILLAIAIAILSARSQGRQYSKQLRDSTHLRGIHQSMLVAAREDQGMLPRPGLVHRLPFNGIITPGRGEEDVTQNTTANLFSMCIMMNYFTPELCVGPTEPSTHVKVFGVDGVEYNFSKYNPANNTHWDINLKADLHQTSHISYAHRVLFGDELKHWRDTMDATLVVLGNRGPLGGAHDPNSITNRIHPPNNVWSGNLVFSDNHVLVGLKEFPTKPRDEGVQFRIAPECLKTGAIAPSTDALITFTKEMTIEGPVVQHD